MMDIQATNLSKDNFNFSATASKQEFKQLYAEICADTKHSVFDEYLYLLEQAPNMYVMLKDLVCSHKVDSVTSGRIKSLIGRVENKELYL